jgi:hypothetical protein
MLIWNLLTLGVSDLIWFYTYIKFQFQIKHSYYHFSNIIACTTLLDSDREICNAADPKIPASDDYISPDCP